MQAAGQAAAGSICDTSSLTHSCHQAFLRPYYVPSPGRNVGFSSQGEADTVRAFGLAGLEPVRKQHRLSPQDRLRRK